MISAAIITYNEEANIERCIASLLPVVDEVVVVDSFSTDATGDICKRLGVVFIQNPFPGHIEQKNFAISKCSQPWVLSLDADEVLTKDLAYSIKNADLGSHDAFELNRLSNFCGHWIHHGGWYPDTKIRFFKKGTGAWGGTNPHDKYIVKKGTRLGKLKGDLLHYTFTSFEQHKAQIEKFSSIAAQAKFNQGKSSNLFHASIKAFAKFLRNFLVKSGYRDGKIGFYLAKMSAIATFKKYRKLQKLR